MRVAVLAAAVGTHAVLAALRLVLGVVAEVDQRVVALRRLHDDVAAAAAVAAGRAAAGHELLAPKGHAAVAAVAGFHSDFGFIDKHDGLRPWFGMYRPDSNALALLQVYRSQSGDSGIAASDSSTTALLIDVIPHTLRLEISNLESFPNSHLALWSG